MILGKTQWSGEKNIMSKSSKYILSVGCSYTDPNFKSQYYPEFDTSYKKWPNLVGDYLNLSVKNLARSGVDNEYIFRKAVEDIILNHKNIELVVLGWTEWHRFNVYELHNHNPASYIRKHHLENGFCHSDWMNAAQDYYEWLFRDIGKKPPTARTNIVRVGLENLFNRIFLIQELCDTFNIKHIQMSLSGSVNRWYQWYAPLLGENFQWEPDNETFQAIMHCESFLEVNGSHVVGWPFLKSLNGFEYNGSPGARDPETIVGPKDPHPNEEGHKKIAQYFIEKYKEIYL